MSTPRKEYDCEVLKRRLNVVISHLSEAEKILKAFLDEINQIQDAHVAQVLRCLSSQGPRRPWGSYCIARALGHRAP